MTIGDVVRVVLLFYLMPLWTVLLARVVLHERLTAGGWLRVGLGRSSVNTIEIKEGLQPGDQVILSDMSAWDGRDRVRLR